MKALRVRSPDGVFAVEFGARALRLIDQQCAAAGSCETGGILIGSYTADLSTAVVVEATGPPRDSSAGHTWFVRGVSGLRELLLARWAASERRYYVGEWHYHPSIAVEPSTDDIDQIARIARAREYQCREPILAIFGARRLHASRLARVFVHPPGTSAIELLP